MNKVVRVYLICNHADKDGNIIPHNEIYRLLWDLQKQTREIKNKTVQLCWEWYNFSSDYYKKNGEYPKDKDILGLTLDGFVNDQFKASKGKNNLASANCSMTSRSAVAKFKNDLGDMLSGTKSIPTFGKDQPLDLHKNSIKLSYIDNNFFFDIALIDQGLKKTLNYSNTSLHFKAFVKDDSSRTILERCIDGVYNISSSTLQYDRRKKMWYLNLCYAFEKTINNNLDKDKILGVDLGVCLPLMASVYGSKDRLSFTGDDIIHHRKSVEGRRRAMLKQSAHCGQGRVGHGYKKRVQPIEKLSESVTNFRNTKNHIYSKALVDYAIKNNCGTIQMEDLTGITANTTAFLKNWSYYDLQTKIKYKADVQGIQVKFVKPRYTSQRCSKCGNINTDNRPNQSTFCCSSCGFEENADYNASQNLSIKDIDKIIDRYINH